MTKKEAGKFFVSAVFVVLCAITSFTNVYALPSEKQNGGDSRKRLDACAIDKIRLDWAYNLRIKKPSHREFSMENNPKLSVVKGDDGTELATLSVPNSYEGTFSMSCKFRIINAEQSDGIAIGVKSSGDRMCLFEIVFKLTDDNRLAPFLHAVSNEGNVVTKDGNVALEAGSVYTMRLDYTDNALRCLILDEKGKTVWDTRGPEGDILFDGRWFDIDCIFLRAKSIGSFSAIKYDAQNKSIVVSTQSINKDRQTNISKTIEIYRFVWDVPGAGIGPNNIRQILIKESEIPSPMFLRPDLRVSCSEWSMSMVTVAPSIPVVGKECILNVKVANDGKSAARHIPVKLIISSPDVSAVPIQKIKLIKKLDAGRATLLKFKFVPEQTGTYQATVIVDPVGKILEINESNNSFTLSFPVVRDSYVIYYHHPRRLPLARIRYKTLVNVYYGNPSKSTNMKEYGLLVNEKESEYWKRYGVDVIRICSVPYKSAEKRVKYWAERGPGPILIEEIGSNWKGEKARLMRDSIILFRKKFPNRFFALYTGPRIPPIIAPVLRNMNLIVPECYYLHEGQYEHKDFGKAYFTKMGLSNKTMILLGVDSRRGPDPRTSGNRITPRWSPGYCAVERQIQTLRSKWPENHFCGFYITFADSKLISEVDRLVYRYYIMPVLKVEHSISSKFVKVHNIGGMDAQDVKLRITGKNTARNILVPIIKAGNFVRLTLNPTEDTVIILPNDDSYTILSH